MCSERNDIYGRTVCFQLEIPVDHRKITSREQFWWIGGAIDVVPAKHDELAHMCVRLFRGAEELAEILSTQLVRLEYRVETDIWIND
ncbi:hypothetical protein [Halalkalicoccus salilacus]|uniref:hypothetical protein n=1 Tax=Halalkalicoccus salilacus TaxID=3117459 RepID=UPI00300ED39B